MGSTCGGSAPRTRARPSARRLFRVIRRGLACTEARRMVPGSEPSQSDWEDVIRMRALAAQVLRFLLVLAAVLLFAMSAGGVVHVPSSSATESRPFSASRRAPRAPPAPPRPPTDPCPFACSFRVGRALGARVGGAVSSSLLLPRPLLLPRGGGFGARPRPHGPSQRHSGDLLAPPPTLPAQPVPRPGPEPLHILEPELQEPFRVSCDPRSERALFWRYRI